MTLFNSLSSPLALAFFWRCATRCMYVERQCGRSAVRASAPNEAAALFCAAQVTNTKATRNLSESRCCCVVVFQ